MMEQNKSPFKIEQVSIRLVKDAPLYSQEPLDNPKKVVEALAKELSEMDREVICIVNMNAKSIAINYTIASVGTITNAITCPRELLKSSILSNATGMIMLHNHPSGDPTPSYEDMKLTARIGAAYEIIGIDLLDHIIVAGRTGEYFSFNENRLLQSPNEFQELAANHTVEKEKTLMAAEKARSR